MKKEHPRLNKIKKWFDRHEYCKVALILFVIVFLCFAPQSLRNGLTMPVHGDYILQQLHFYVEGYDAWWNFFRTGQVEMWSYEGFLGVNYIGANTFYYLTSPFLLPMLLFPRSLLPQAIFFMYMVKLTLGGLFFYILLRKYWKLSPRVCLLGAIAYSLSGWGMYYLWFNHFADVLAVFPLTLIGVEHCLQKKQGWLIAVSFLLCGMVNYYFFFAWVITSFLYAIFRYFVLYKQNKGYNLRILITGFLYFAVGIGMAGFILLTALEVISSMGRVESSSLLLELLQFFFNNPTKSNGHYDLGTLKSLSQFFGDGNFKGLLNYLFVFKDRNIGETIGAGETFAYPLVGFLFFPVNNWDTIVFTNTFFDNTISSFYCGVPMILMFVPAAIKTFKSKNVWKIIALCFMIILPFIPITYYLFNAFAMMYGRWQLFLVAAMLLFTLPMIEKFKDLPKKWLDISLVVVLALMASVIIYSFSINKVSFEYGRGYLMFVYVAYVIAVYVFLRKKCYGENGFERIFYVTLIEMLVAGNITAFGQGVSNYFELYGGRAYIKEQQQIINDIKAADPSFYRIFDTLSNRSSNNLAMTLGYKSISTFHSVYDYELNTFINDWSKISYSYYNWSMGVEEKRANLDTFLNVKYYILDKDDNNIPFGYTLYKEYEYYNVYVNNYQVELGYAFDKMIDINNLTLYYDYYQIEPYYNRYAIVAHKDLAELQEILGSSVTTVSNTTNKLLTDFDTANNASYYLKVRGTNIELPVDSFASADYYLPEERKNSDGVTYYYGTDNRDGSVGDQIIVKFDKGLSVCSSATAANPCHIVTRLNYGPNMDVAFYNGDTLITNDTHSINYYDHGADHKFGRGYYVDQPVDRMVITMVNDAKASLVKNFGFGVSYEYFDSYKAQQEKLQANAFENIKVTNNTIDFDTNYDSSKMIVLTVPYDKGWSLQVNGTDTKIYEVDSGFIGFVAPAGQTSYSLKYYTPGLSRGIKLTLISLVAFIILTLLTHYRRLKEMVTHHGKPVKKVKPVKEEVIFGLFDDKPKRIENPKVIETKTKKTKTKKK